MQEPSISEQIDNIIQSYEDWRGEVLSQLRIIINSTDPRVVEEVKWKTASRPQGLPVWSYDGIICIAETWKDNVKLIFFKGALMSDPHNLFNARLKSSMDRAIEFREGDLIDESTLKELVAEAVKLNNSKPS